MVSIICYQRGFFWNVDDIIIQVVLGNFLNDILRDLLWLSMSLSKNCNRVCVWIFWWWCFQNISAHALKLSDFVNVEKLEPVVIQVLYFSHQIDYPKQYDNIVFLALSKIQNKYDFLVSLQLKNQRKNWKIT